MSETKIIRVAQGKHSTLSHLYVNRLFGCYLLEDTIRAEKIPGETCIPTGIFKLKMNKDAGMNERYFKAYPKMHQGMIEISGLPNFSLVFIHIGNYHTDTAGCPLTGHYWMHNGDDFSVMQSAFAYGYIYPKLVRQIESGNDIISIENFTTL